MLECRDSILWDRFQGEIHSTKKFSSLDKKLQPEPKFSEKVFKFGFLGEFFALEKNSKIKHGIFKHLSNREISIFLRD